MRDREHKRVIGVHLERDDVRKRLMTALRMLNGDAAVPGQTGKDVGTSPILSNIDDTSAMNSSPNPGRRSSYHTAAARSSARASRCSSTRTTVLELLQDLHPRGAPVDRLNLTLRDLARSALQLGRPRCRNFLVVSFLQAGEQLLRYPNSLLAGQLEHLREKFIR